MDSRALISLSVAVACAKATDEDLIPSGEGDSGGTSGTGASPFGGASGFSGSPSGGKGGTTTGGTSGKAGAGGTSSEGGAPTGGTSGSDGGASDGGEGPDACAPTATIPTLHLDYQASMRAVTEDPEGTFQVVNGTLQPIPLSELTVRYWFHSEFTCSETTDRMLVNVVAFQFDNPYAAKTTADVTKTVVALGSGAPGCDAYFELGFPTTTGSLAPNQMATVKYFAQIPIYETSRPHDQSNDYSYGACTTDTVFFEKVTLYRTGRLVSGSEPGGDGGAGGEGGGGMGGV